MDYELMGHKMSSNKSACEVCGEPKGRIVAMGLACAGKVEMEDDHDASLKMEMESEE